MQKRGSKARRTACFLKAVFSLIKKPSHLTAAADHGILDLCITFAKVLRIFLYWFDVAYGYKFSCSETCDH